MEVALKKIVTKIEANPILVTKRNENYILRVAAYCRVSTDSEDQLESYKAQVAYYSDAIAKNPRWRLVEIYADEGITGTLDKKRPNFMRMIRDCDKGKIDLILTKSVARFARNTVDSLRYVRKLKAKGIGVYFEEQAIDSLKTENEMAIGLYSVMAQAESENISANVRWGIQQRMKSGTFKFRYNLLGYEKGEDGNPKIVEEEAKIIREIFALFLDGKSIGQIKDILQEKGYKTKKGNNVWMRSIIEGILKNEKYCGDMLLQKTFTENCITKKTKVNNGEFPKYLIKNNHPAIVDEETFKKAQIEFSKRGAIKKTSDITITQNGKYSGKYPLSSVMFCGECGSPYKRKTFVINGQKVRTWRCNSRIEHGKKYCHNSITIPEDVLHRSICEALKNAMEKKKEIYDAIIANVSYGVTLNQDVLDIYAIEKQVQSLNDLVDKTMKMAAQTTGDKSKYLEEISELNKKIQTLNYEVNSKKECIKSNLEMESKINDIKNMMNNIELNFNEYRETYIRRFIENIRVSGTKLEIMIKGGIEVEQELLF